MGFGLLLSGQYLWLGQLGRSQWDGGQGTPVLGISACICPA